MRNPMKSKRSLVSPSKRLPIVSFLAIILSLIVPAIVCAQGGTDRDIDITSFRTPPGPDALLSTEGTALTQPGGVTIGATLRWVDQPLVLRDAAGEEIQGLESEGAGPIAGRLHLDIGLAVGIAEWLELALFFPMTLYQGGEHLFPNSTLLPLSAVGTGDLRLRAKFAVFSSANDGLGLGFVVEGAFPTGLRGTFLGDGGFGFDALVLGDLRFQGWHLAVALGYRLRPERHFGDLDVDDEFLWRVALRAPIPGDVAIIGEVTGAHGLLGPDGAFGAQDENPILMHLGIELPEFRDVRIVFGGGLGLTSGYGAPRFDLFMQIRAQPQDHDFDGDELMDHADDCPQIPEDVDGFEDGDGCPDEDNDQDGLQDFIDGCPDEAEDIDGFDDEDGCPEPDNDEDGLEDGDDECPDEAEDIDDFQDGDGCPDPDTDGDGLDDPIDRCPNEAEDADGFEDGDGCPDLDNDQDGVRDTDDQCRDEPEDLDGFEDDDGCADDDNDGDGIPDVQDECPTDAEDDDDFEDDDGCPERRGRIRAVPQAAD